MPMSESPSGHTEPPVLGVGLWPAPGTERAKAPPTRRRNRAPADRALVGTFRPTRFAVETTDGGHGVAVIAVRGDSDLHTAPHLRRAITVALDRGASALVIDLTDATLVDSMTLGVLLGAVKRLRPSCGRVTVVCPARDVRRIFEITLLDRLFSLHPDREAAVAAASGRLYGAAGGETV
jgi:anti-sigma B factor antagonist